jgi:O-antigen ligase
LLIFGVVLSGSRTGALGVLVLSVWGLCDRRLSTSARALLLAAPLFYGLAWAGMWAWAHQAGHVFGAEGRLSLNSGGDISSSRFAIWSNAWEMVLREPLLGVGLGEFNLAWTLTEFPMRCWCSRCSRPGAARGMAKAIRGSPSAPPSCW